jgi:hypothetical protein
MVTALAAAVAAPWVAWAVVRVFGLEAGHPLVGAMALTPHAAATSALPVGVALHGGWRERGWRRRAHTGPG